MNRPKNYVKLYNELTATWEMKITEQMNIYPLTA